jgi:YfiH family protein
MSELPLYYFRNLSSFHRIKHFISGRQGGVSTGETGALNLSFRVSDEESHVKRNRELVAQALGIEAGKLVVPSQTHSDHIAEVRPDNYKDVFADTDGFVTNTPGLCIAVLSADCVPVLLYDPSTHSAAAIHAGWRGTVASIVPKTIEKMKQLYGADPSHIRAGIGPSICSDVYEVGAEVAEEFYKVFDDHSKIVRPKENDKFLIDLWEANKTLLVKAGVKQENIETSGICTYTNADKFFSARRSANKAGRFGAGIVLM